MPEFLTTYKASSYIEDIIRKANKNLVLVSPFLNLSDNLSTRLMDASSRNVEIIIIYGKNKLKPASQKQLEKLKNLSLYFCKELHAKCYFNETAMVITSMNMYDYSERNNREMGVYISKAHDSNLYNEALLEVESILRNSTKETIETKSQDTYYVNNHSPGDKQETRAPSIAHGFKPNNKAPAYFQYNKNNKAKLNNFIKVNPFNEKSCPRCKEGFLVERVSSIGEHVGEKFLGCSRYPKCRYKEEIQINKAVNPRRTCKTCGAELQPGFIFCHICGERNNQ